MKNKGIKLSALLLAACVLFISCTTGGGTSSESGSTATEGSTGSSATTSEGAVGGNTDILNEVGTYPIVKEPITMEMFAMSAPNVIDLETNDFTKFLEEKTGITWTFQTAPNDAATEKINLLMASNNYPDAFMFKTPDVPQFGLKEQLLMPIDELIPENMPNYYGEFMSKQPELYNLQKQSDGHIYGVASWNECYHCNYYNKMWVNTMWLEKMGMEVPTTTEELKATLAKFLEMNPNGIGITGSTTGWGEQFYDFLTGSFLTNPGRRSGKPEDYLVLSPEGKIVTAPATDEYREALRFMNELYDMGAIYDGGFTQDSGMFKSLVNQDDEPVLFFASGVSVNQIDAAESNELYRNYRAVAPFKGPEGVQIATNFKYDSLVENKFVLTNKCKYPEAALRWADHFYSVQGYLEYQFGSEEGVDWVLNPEGKVGLNGEPAVFEVLNKYSAEPQNHDWQDIGLIYAPAFLRLGEATDTDVDVMSPEGLEKLLFDETKEKMEPYAQKAGDYDVLPNRFKLTPEESYSVQTSGVEIENYIKENRVAFVTGQKSVDTDWDAYIAGFDKIGLPDYLKTMQTAWDRQNNA